MIQLGHGETFVSYWPTVSGCSHNLKDDVIMRSAAFMLIKSAVVLRSGIAQPTKSLPSKVTKYLDFSRQWAMLHWIDLTACEEEGDKLCVAVVATNSKFRLKLGERSSFFHHQWQGFQIGPNLKFRNPVMGDFKGVNSRKNAQRSGIFSAISFRGVGCTTSLRS